MTNKDIEKAYVGDQEVIKIYLGSDVIYENTPTPHELPSNTFLFNFNAKEYVASAKTIPNNSGGTLGQDMVFRKTNSGYTNIQSGISAYDDHVYFSGGMYCIFTFSYNSNPFTISSTKGKNLTFIIKFWRDPVASKNPVSQNPMVDVFMCRGSSPNSNPAWGLRISDDKASFLTKSDNNAHVPSAVTWSANPVVVVYRVTDGVVSIKNVTENISNTPFTPSDFGGSPNRATFFAQSYQADQNNATNLTQGSFYWAYCSREALTEEEIAQVIDYNERL